MLNPSELTALLASFSALLGVGWTIYSGKKRNQSRTSSTMFDEAVEMLKQKSLEINRLNGRVGELERQVGLLERKNRRLIQMVSQARHVPIEIVELDNEFHDEETERTSG